MFCLTVRTMITSSKSMKRKLEGHFTYNQRWDYIVHFMFQLRLDSEKYFSWYMYSLHVVTYYQQNCCFCLLFWCLLIISKLYTWTLRQLERIWEYIYCLKLSKMSIVAYRFVGLWLVDVYDEVQNFILLNLHVWKERNKDEEHTFTWLYGHIAQLLNITWGFCVNMGLCCRGAGYMHGWRGQFLTGGQSRNSWVLGLSLCSLQAFFLCIWPDIRWCNSCEKI